MVGCCQHRPRHQHGPEREGFWSRITNGYNSNRGPHVERSLKSLSSRFDHIKEQCAKFSDYYTQILHVNPSGMSDADKVSCMCPIELHHEL